MSHPGDMEMHTDLAAQRAPAPDTVAIIEAIETRLRWLSSWTIHNANHLRDSRDGLKVGGHQASCASMTAIMAALYFGALRPQDRVAVKPHAGPVLHAIHYLLGQQSLEALQRYRGFGGAQSYPSRTKDTIPVDFSTGSVGLGVAITAFASLVQDYLIAHGNLDEAQAGRMIALMGDAELDEGNIYECLIEGYKHDIRNCWWIVDYNRQSLDSTTADRMFRRFDDIFETCGWRVVTLKHGKRQRAAFAEPGGAAIAEWIDNCPNAEFAALTYQGGAAWRARLDADLAGQPDARALIAGYDDAALAALMTNLGGHCIETLLDAFAACDDSVPTLFIAYTVKGYGLPFAGHKDNHSGLMNPGQIEGLRDSLGIAPGDEARSPGQSRPPPSAPCRCPIICRPPTAPRYRPRRRSAASCSIWPNRATRWPIASSRPRPTSPSRPISARSSISADCSGGRSLPTSFPPRAFRPRRNGPGTAPASISNWASPKTICSWCSPLSACRRRSSGRG